jgi:hypothetical protein
MGWAVTESAFIGPSTTKSRSAAPVELGEIEAALREHPVVGQAAVSPTSDPRELQLVGWRRRDDTAPDSSADERRRTVAPALRRPSRSRVLFPGSDFPCGRAATTVNRSIEHMRDWTRQRLSASEHRARRVLNRCRHRALARRTRTTC